MTKRKDHPEVIEKRLFTCKSCGYKAHVYREMYWDYGCHNYIATFRCYSCNILYEDLISTLKLDDIEFKAYHDLADDFQCLSCGENNSKVWKREEGNCPKCENVMEVDVVGKIQLKTPL